MEGWGWGNKGTVVRNFWDMLTLSKRNLSGAVLGVEGGQLVDGSGSEKRHEGGDYCTFTFIYHKGSPG